MRCFPVAAVNLRFRGPQGFVASKPGRVQLAKVRPAESAAISRTLPDRAARSVTDAWRRIVTTGVRWRGLPTGIGTAPQSPLSGALLCRGISDGWGG